MKSALELLRSRSLLPLFLTQFGGTLNDYLFKSALLVLVAFQLTQDSIDASLINNLAFVLFIIPLLLISPLAGQLGDRVCKTRMIQKNKIAEIIISILAIFALFSESIQAMLSVLFLLGVQSAMFGPNKYALLPQLLAGTDLVKGNAIIASGTLVAILVGTILGSLFAAQSLPWLWVGGTCLLTATAGYLAARRIPETEIGDAHLNVDWNIGRQARILLALARRNSNVWLGIVGISWFWFSIASYLIQLPAWVRYSLGGTEVLVTILLSFFVLGIMVGSFWAARASGERAEIGMPPLALIGLGITGLLLTSVAADGSTQASFDSHLSGAFQFLTTVAGFQSAALILLLGCFSGALALPFFVELQQSTRQENRARIIAINNVLNALFMLMSATLAIAILSVWGQSEAIFLQVIAFLNLLFGFYLSVVLIRRVLRYLARPLSQLMYSLDTREIEKLPETGAALVVCNHISYTDPIIIFGACRRPIRFLMDKTIMETNLLKSVFNGAGAIPLCSPLENKRAYFDALNTAITALKNEELVFIFPEGQLTRDGEIADFKRGLEKILEACPVQTYPMALRGLWGSFFSYEGGKVLSGFNWWPSRRPVTLLVGDALPPGESSAQRLYLEVANLRGTHH